MRRLVHSLRLWPTLLILAGCAINPGVRTTSGPDASLVYGYFDMADSPRTLWRVFLTQDKRVGIVYRPAGMNTYADGLFFMENVPPKQYVIPYFSAGARTYDLASGSEHIFDVAPGSMKFVGAFIYVRNDDQDDSDESFTLQPTTRPTEAEVLRLLIDRVEDPLWRKRIAERLEIIDRQLTQADPSERVNLEPGDTAAAMAEDPRIQAQ